MKIGLYFGSFNPIHHGHLIIANHALQTTNLKEVWFVVSPQNPFKLAHSLLNERHRLQLVKTAIEEEKGLKACDVEFFLPKPSYTSNTIVYLKEKYPQHHFAILMGSDGFQNIDSWKNAAYLFENAEFYIYPRPGFEFVEKKSVKTNVLDAPLLQISSTHIRDLIAEKKSIRFFEMGSSKIDTTP